MLKYNYSKIITRVNQLPKFKIGLVSNWLTVRFTGFGSQPYSDIKQTTLKSGLCDRHIIIRRSNLLHMQGGLENLVCILCTINVQPDQLYIFMLYTLLQGI